MSRLTYLNESRETTELTQFEGDSWQELIKNADTVDQVFMHNAIDKLYEYEDLEEQGLLLKLPCKIGDTVYVIGCKYRNGTFEKWINTGKFNYSDLEKMNKTVFLTKEEAEQELKRLEGAE